MFSVIKIALRLETTAVANQQACLVFCKLMVAIRNFIEKKLK
ncbi:hypothetical protein W04_1197 [Pseudoalteromonas sp. SW0106-04]|nr:hypothetical protein W04_1197 [Pseudoalteromonas sp. SW0106-04]